MVNDHRIECVSFEEPLFGISVQTEIRVLSKAFMRVMLGHMTKLDRGEIDPFQLQPWRQYEEMPVILVPLNDELMIYVVEPTETNSEETTKINVMFAGVRSQGYQGLDGTWDGSDESLWRDIVAIRCDLHFRN
ncbi:MAG TPA: hypothetical protein VGM57_11870 [Pseudolabrys sp.]|jgi:hypothetical protein